VIVAARGLLLIRASSPKISPLHLSATFSHFAPLSWLRELTMLEVSFEAEDVCSAKFTLV